MKPGVTMETFRTRAEWLEARKGTVGGSDASAVVGLNPYKDSVTLWEEKTGRRESEDISDKPYVVFGSEAESSIRRLFALDNPDLKVCYRQNNLWRNEAYPWAHNSADGWIVDKDGRLGVLEIKTTNILQSMQKEKWHDRIPDNYYCQVLHAMAVMGAEFAILKARLKSVWDGGEIYIQVKHYRIERSEVEEDIEYLMAEERKFADCIKNNRRPALVLPPI